MDQALGYDISRSFCSNAYNLRSNRLRAGNPISGLVTAFKFTVQQHLRPSKVKSQVPPAPELRRGRSTTTYQCRIQQPRVSVIHVQPGARCPDSRFCSKWPVELPSQPGKNTTVDHRMGHNNEGRYILLIVYRRGLFGSLGFRDPSLVCWWTAFLQFSFDLRFYAQS